MIITATSSSASTGLRSLKLQFEVKKENETAIRVPLMS
uniref:Uncharacterized protein n=1 Tax=Arundo donax TaxID=35708 RepID=A0A0A9E5S3_ARUDO